MDEPKAIHVPGGCTYLIDEWIPWKYYSTIDFYDGNNPINIRFFNYGIGNPVPRQGNISERTATKSDTNFPPGSQISVEEEFRVFAVTFEVFERDPRIKGIYKAGTTYPTPTGALGFRQSPTYDPASLRVIQALAIFELLVGDDAEDKPSAQLPMSRIGQSVGAFPWVQPVGQMYNFVDRFDLIDIAQNATGESTFLAPFYHATAGPITPTNQIRFVVPIHIKADQRLQAVFRSEEPFPHVPTTMRFYLDGLRKRPGIV